MSHTETEKHLRSDFGKTVERAQKAGVLHTARLEAGITSQRISEVEDPLRVIHITSDEVLRFKRSVENEIGRANKPNAEAPLPPTL